jgi:hypothetical protein
LRPDHQEFTDSLKLAAIAGVAAVLTATVVIGAGRAVLQESHAAASAAGGDLIQVSVR